MSRDPLAMGDIAGSFYEYLNLTLMLDANALLVGAHALGMRRDALVRVSEWIGEIDLALNVAWLRADGRAWCTPTCAMPGSPVAIAGAWHPALAAPVANSVRIAPGAGIVITGSNMSGKSTFLRTVGVSVVLAEALNMCPAAEYSAPRLAVRTCIGRADDIASGQSYYLAEVRAVLEIMRAAREPGAHLFLFDELFRGTNTVERLAAGEAVLRELVGRNGRLEAPSVIVATHDGELVAMLSERFAPFHFRETIAADGLAFDYTMRPGAATTRSALALLELEGAPPALIAAARARAEELDAG
jgi:DNA mismatch repair ATPase MutS